MAGGRQGRAAAAAALGAALLAGCGPAQGGPGEADAGPPPSLYPLQVGNRWTYQVTDVSSGAVSRKETTVESFGAMDGTKDGVEAFALRTVQGPDRSVAFVEPGEGFAYRHREEVYPGGVLLDTQVQLPRSLRGPLTAPAQGESWSEQYTEETYDPRGALLRSKVHAYSWSAEGEVEVSVPAGTFRALKLVRVKTTSGKQKTTWWAPGVGKVKDDDQSDGTIEELESFQVQP